MKRLILDVVVILGMALTFYCLGDNIENSFFFGLLSGMGIVLIVRIVESKNKN